MFNKQNFCHIASNNRNDVKAGVFVYKTTDNIQTVRASGYFNEKIVDINLHDLIIHEWHDPADRTKVQYNLLCVTERTLDNVGTTIIHTGWEEVAREAILTIEGVLNNLPNIYLKLDGTNTMTGPLKMRSSVSFKCAIAPSWDGVGFYKLNDNDSLTLMASMESTDGLCPATNNTYNLGKTNYKWKDAYVARVITAVINNGFDIAVPVTNQADTLALKSEVDTAANSGSQLTNKGVWYAKMYAATVPPAAEDGTNYADFSQTDGQGNPIIVTYNRVNGAWVQDQTITPPADYNGYVTITSKIWDIVEQAGQQGGKVLWAHNTKTFTPYPQIVSFEDAALTGTPTAPNLSPSSPSTQIVNKQSLDNALLNHGTGRNVGDIFFTMRTDSALNGSVACDGSIYNTGDFSGAQSIGDLLEDGKVPYVSMADYATALAADGSVGVFGWDGAGNTTFRVPSLNDIFIETGTAAQIGDYLAPKIPNLKGSVFIDGTNGPNSFTGVFKAGQTQYSYRNTNNTHDNIPAVEMDASIASGVYDDSATTVQPSAVRYRAMVQLAISATDEAVETCTSVLADVAANTAAIAGADYVVESQFPTAENNYTWYRKYKSGWVEQGGLATNSSGDSTVTLPIEMSDTNYNITATNESTTAENAWGWVYVSKDTKATTGFGLSSRSGSGQAVYLRATWEVKGMAA